MWYVHQTRKKTFETFNENRGRDLLYAMPTPAAVHVYKQVKTVAPLEYHIYSTDFHPHRVIGIYSDRETATSCSRRYFMFVFIFSFGRSNGPLSPRRPSFVKKKKPKHATSPSWPILRPTFSIRARVYRYPSWHRAVWTWSFATNDVQLIRESDADRRRVDGFRSLQFMGKFAYRVSPPF